MTNTWNKTIEYIFFASKYNASCFDNGMSNIRWPNKFDWHIWTPVNDEKHTIDKMYRVYLYEDKYDLISSDLFHCPSIIWFNWNKEILDGINMKNTDAINIKNNGGDLIKLG